MKLTKQLVIMSGKGYEKGTVCLEKNALSIHGRANLHSLRNLSHEEYLLLIICSEESFFVQLGNLGTSSKQFSLPYESDISSLHCAVLVGETIALYGTNEYKKMWESNIVDIARRKNIESEKNNNEKTANAGSQEYSAIDGQHTNTIQKVEQKKNINDFFLDIINDYDDDAVAEVNYYCMPKKPQINEDTITHPSIHEDFSSVTNHDSTAVNPDSATVQNNSHPTRPPLTEKYYDRLHKADSELEQKNIDLHPESMTCCKEKNSGIDDSQSYNEIYSNKKFKEYYDSLKEKYGYNRNVLNDYKIRETTKNLEENIANQNHFISENSDSIQEQVSQSVTENNHNSSFSDDCESREKSMPVEEFFQKEPSILAHNKDETEKQAIRKTEEYTKKDSAFSFLKSSVGREQNIFNVESATTTNYDTAPPLESSFSRIRLGTFYEQIKNQLDDIFKKYPESSELENLIPDSRWVRVDYNGDGKYYVVGIIGKPDYICYGVPATYTPEPPSELDGYCQWLPIDISNPTNRGYWLLFQDAVSGESIKNEII